MGAALQGVIKGADYGAAVEGETIGAEGTGESSSLIGSTLGTVCACNSSSEGSTIGAEGALGSAAIKGEIVGAWDT